MYLDKHKNVFQFIYIYWCKRTGSDLSIPLNNLNADSFPAFHSFVHHIKIRFFLCINDTNALKGNGFCLHVKRSIPI